MFCLNFKYINSIFLFSSIYLFILFLIKVILESNWLLCKLAIVKAIPRSTIPRCAIQRFTIGCPAIRSISIVIAFTPFTISRRAYSIPSVLTNPSFWNPLFKITMVVLIASCLGPIITVGVIKLAIICVHIRIRLQVGRIIHSSCLSSSKISGHSGGRSNGSKNPKGNDIIFHQHYDFNFVCLIVCLFVLSLSEFNFV